MANTGGHGPPPKPADQRARRHKDTIDTRVVPLHRAKQPPLPPAPFEDGWHPQTEVWWQMWSRNPLAADFTEADWDYLTDTAIYHSRMWKGDSKAEAAVRLRVANFGVTPADRARLRIVYADANAKESSSGRTSGGGTVSTKPEGGAYGGLKLAD